VLLLVDTEIMAVVVPFDMVDVDRAILVVGIVDVDKEKLVVDMEKLVVNMGILVVDMKK